MSFYPYISQKLIYPFYEKVSGRKLLDKLAFLKKSQWWSHEDVSAYQWNKLKRLLNYVFVSNPFYRKRMLEAGLNPDRISSYVDFQRLPVLRKDEIASDPTALFSEAYLRKDLVVDMTSGSTGRNLTFYSDRNTLDWMAAAVLRNSEWYGVGFGDVKLKLWGALIGDSLSQKFYMSMRNMFLRERLISCYELDDSKLAEIVSDIITHRPKALIGYVSALDILARFIEARRITDLNIPAVIPAAETLFDHQRNLFERAFHAAVFNRYGCHEFTAIAHECGEHSGMHINAETVFVEILNNGQPADPSELGEIVITDLENFGSPFIRYRMEDLGALKPGLCACGRGLPLLDKVEGRVYDLILCPNGRTQTGTFFCKLTRSIEGVNEFQVIQEARDRIRMKLVTSAEFRSDSISFLRDQIRLNCGGEMETEFEFVDYLMPLRSGKRRYVISMESQRATVCDR
jgi:phenylacetate-CoA ligase